MLVMVARWQLINIETGATIPNVSLREIHVALDYEMQRPEFNFAEWRIAGHLEMMEESQAQALGYEARPVPFQIIALTPEQAKMLIKTAGDKKAMEDDPNLN